jgi:hypothetical protein
MTLSIRRLIAGTGVYRDRGTGKIDGLFAKRTGKVAALTDRLKGRPVEKRISYAGSNDDLTAREHLDCINRGLVWQQE